MIRRYLLMTLLPVAVAVGYMLSSGFGGFFDDAWDGLLGPLLLTYWIGLGFTWTWDLVAESMHLNSAPPWLMAAVGLAGAAILLSMLGSVDALVADPWLFGVAIAPGLRLAGPWLSGRTKDVDHT